MNAGIRRLLLLLAALGTPAAPASADWLVIPFAGTAFGGQTAFLNLEEGANQAQTVFGVSGGWLSSQILGIEGDFMHGPGFFERGGAPVISASSVSTFSGSVVAALPLAVTRESLRPYAVAGLGVMRTSVSYVLDVIPAEDRTGVAMQVGGGALGFVSPRTGYRFDLRHIRGLDRAVNRLTGEPGRTLSFWRLSIGFVIRVR